MNLLKSFHYCFIDEEDVRIVNDFEGETKSFNILGNYKSGYHLYTQIT